MSSLPHPWAGYLEKVRAAENPIELEALRHDLFGRKAGALTVAMRDMAQQNDEKKKELGQLFNTVKRELEAAFGERMKALDAQTSQALVKSDALDLSIDVPPESRGHLHLVHEFIRQAQEVFGRMGFDTADGPELETEEFNFNKLNIPPDHPARDMQDTFWVSTKDRTVLRTHTSSVQIHYMLRRKPPFRMICTGKVYRRDSDATHSPMFHQIEGLMIGKDVSLANMKAVMESAIRELIDPSAEFRWRSGFFPFVEPGLEVDVRWRGDESKSREGRWLEIVGCGMVHPNVLTNVGIDPAEYQGFAFGFGVERMIMIKHQIADLRKFYSGDLKFLKQF